MIDQEIQVRPAAAEEWDEAMQLVLRTFTEFDAPDYAEEGIANFYNFVTDAELHRLFMAGEYQLYVALYEGKIRGIISLREKKHISLLFVEGRYHRNGIGKSLISYARARAVKEKKTESITVNASPYAVGFYQKQGFCKLGEEMTADGIRFTPMKMIL